MSIVNALIVSSEGERQNIAKKMEENARDERMANRYYIRTKEEYWQVVYDWWDDLLSIMRRFIPMEGYEDKDGTILEVPLWQYIVKLKDKRDLNLDGYFQSTWLSAPDSGWIHGIKGWDILCDLCSESYVLYEDEGREYTEEDNILIEENQSSSNTSSFLAEELEVGLDQDLNLK